MVTESAYLLACRALNWRTAQLRANGIEPLKLNDSHPHEPPIGYDFGVETFEEAWAKKEARGYKYGPNEKEQVRLGWEMARGR